MYRLRCCDCLLVHDMQFKAQMGRVLFRARRNDELTDASRAKNPHRVQKAWARRKVKTKPSPLLTFKATWRAVECPKCFSPAGKRCTTGGSIHVARIAAGKAAQGKRNNRKGSRK